MSNLNIQDQSSNHNYRTELPNLIYEIGLSPQLIGVYSALKRCAGDHGRCIKSESKLSKQLCISKKTLHIIISKLCEINPILGKPLIILENRFSEDGDKDTNSITISDIWPENYQYFMGDKGGRVNSTLPRVNSTLPRVNVTQGVGQNLPYGRVNSTHKEEHIKKNLSKEEQQRVAFFDCLVKDERLTDEHRKALMKFTEDRIILALDYSKKAKINTTLIAMLIWHCNQDEPPEHCKKGDLRKETRKKFKHGEIYNGASCYHSNDAISFERGMTILILNDKTSNYEEELNKILNKFGIKD